MSNRNDGTGSSKPQMTRRDTLKLGLGTSVALGLFGLNARIVAGAGRPGAEGRATRPSTRTGRRCAAAACPIAGIRPGGPRRCISTARARSILTSSPAGSRLPTTRPGPSSSTRRPSSPTAAKITAADVKGSWERRRHADTKNQRVDQVLSNVAGYADVTGGTANEIPGRRDAGRRDRGRHAGRRPIRSSSMRLANHIAPIVKVVAGARRGRQRGRRISTRPTAARSSPGRSS